MARDAEKSQMTGQDQEQKKRKQAAAVDSDDDEVDEAESSDEEANPDDPSSIEHKWGDAWNKFNSD